jgi:dTDP-glucose pyrophosphorylase/mannose-6-phosphate isomerase-like protein (cupin superfamily)
MAGDGIRFREANFKTIKPLIPFDHKPMIEHVISSLGLPNFHYIFIVRPQEPKTQIRKALESIFGNKVTKLTIIEIDEPTRGATETCLYARMFIDTLDPLFIVNCDQIMEWNAKRFCDFVTIGEGKIFDGAVVTIDSQDPMYSYIECDKKSGIATKIAEKQVISNDALVGVHYWKQGKDFIESGDAQISKNIRFKNEFYLSLSYNELIGKKKKIGCYRLQNPKEKFYNVGTPETLFAYLQSQNKLMTHVHNTQFPKRWTVPGLEKSGSKLDLMEYEPNTNLSVKTRLRIYCILEGEILVFPKESGETKRHAKYQVVIVPAGTLTQTSMGQKTRVLQATLECKTAAPDQKYVAKYIQEFVRGRFVGNFNPTIYKTSFFEAALQHFTKDEPAPVHYHKKCKDYNFIVQGKLLVNNVPVDENDLIIFEPRQLFHAKFLTNCVLVNIKVPTSSNDVYIL